jgi:CRISPR-associated protein Cse2 (CRISPR_cse2).
MNPSENAAMPNPEQEDAGHPLGRLAGFIERADLGTRAALARLDPDQLKPHQMAALTRALIASGFEPESWPLNTWKRWALVAHGMALAGNSKGRLGVQLASAGVAESRVTKLLVSRGDAFLQIVPRLLRLLASKQTPPNWYELSELIFWDDTTDPANQARVEDRRRRVAGDYFAALHRINKPDFS